MSDHVLVIGSGFAGLSAATHLAEAGLRVTVLEKNSTPGGRARIFETDGYRFDMGPSWYWMPDVFEDYFNRFGKKTEDYYHLDRLDPSYRVFFGINDVADIHAGAEAVGDYFESLEPGSKAKLDVFLKEAAYKYKVSMTDMVHKPGLSVTEFMAPSLLLKASKLNMFGSISTYIRKHFSHPKILKLLEFPVLFLGAKPSKTPALYSLMNHADIVGGTWYPQGGIHEIIKAMVSLAQEKGVQIIFNSPVNQIRTANGRTTGVEVNGEFLGADAIISGADYHHTESLLRPEERNYGQVYWDKRVMAPSCLLYYLGIRGRLAGLLHHNLFFDGSLERHSEQIYDHPDWPKNPLFYVSCPSVSDSSVAPQGCENLFVLVPVSTELEPTEEIRERYFNIVIDRLERHIGLEIRKHIEVKKDYARQDFISDYNSFKGNAYGLANTLRQTAFLKPSLKNFKVSGLYYTGQLTTPGPGVPPSLISGRVAAKCLLKEMKLETISK